MPQQSSSSPPPSSSSLSNLVRLTPLQLSDLPVHPDLPRPETDDGKGRVDLVAFLTALLDNGASFLNPSAFASTFKHQSMKSSPPSAVPVEILGYSIPKSAIARIQWSGSTSASVTGVGHGLSSTSPPSVDVGDPNGSATPVVPRVSRSTPSSSSLGPENWVARRSVHKDISSKDVTRPGHALWDEFVYGLRDDHSKHEADFTPTLYDAHCVVDWSDVLQQSQVQETLRRNGYMACSMGVYEMCHVIPPPLSPRCFPVVVVTASICRDSSSLSKETNFSRPVTRTKRENEDDDEDCFIAVTVPVDLTSSRIPVPTALYSTQRNLREGKTPQQRKRVVMGAYAAVETVRRKRNRSSSSSSTTGQQTRGQAQAQANGKTENQHEIEWIMATASDAKGNLPLWMQKMGVPGAVAKDVGYFMKWIKGVDDAEMKSRRL
ncbi:hypothetical protein A1O1_01457 [Capronia coronata CBS 617.96]|uniref:DUF3074 domain-containing protein n=1 Tax=Capronia coronata CBS 617.96 TaxID=1182541 RepID=W9Z426_9EURO|nr:uncharacterized protein A1O1_01457 [Capronia coronata CBS 617.96]EXJ96331.1 hypothetical protein A1O1_01457 [Capronia coronata CBS 617.96]